MIPTDYSPAIAPRRVALFAHFDRDGQIDDHVLYYLRSLREVAERILFISDGALMDGQAERLAGLAELVHAGRHGAYDFGSWKLGFQALGADIAAYDEVIVANDSCYGGVFPFAPVFDKMAGRDCDFWGLTDGLVDGDIRYLTSNFLVFRPTVTSHPEFTRFWEGVTRQPDKAAVCRAYEFGLSQRLLSLGFRPGRYLPQAFVAKELYSDIYFDACLETHRMPLVKVAVFSQNQQRVARLRERLERMARYYPVNLIEAHVARLCGTPHPVIHDLPWRQERTRLAPLPGTYRRSKYSRSLRWWLCYVRVLGVPVFATARRVRAVA
ncbi:rhamnan synthesis F family protein [Nitrospirillum sp. BR 11164]|uniref:rhamnan synthesis F family protein n=1 Tax=Nitrospirillum sp. BR 11164 TaxID=3104324 RepID=UPI002AFE0B30|nr:rhamnan synthesis F family protein [Nitrospirillum sp. BR 11164]MEA1653166.1 rhamnan synthesis F family protein [Nitrospirillum sp. BR 11164]